MTHRGLAIALLLAATLAGCGKYGPPMRAGGRPTVSGVTAEHPADCDDPEHHHDTEEDTP